MKNITDFGTSIVSEEDMKIKVLLPFLEELGYKKDELRFENSIQVHIGTKTTYVYSDIEVLINGKVEMVIDAKNQANHWRKKMFCRWLVMQSWSLLHHRQCMVL